MPNLYRDAKSLAALLAGATIGIGAVVLVIGWGLDIAVVRELNTSFAVMVPSTALVFVLCGIGVLRPSLALPVSVVVGIVALIDLVAIGFTDANGIDMLFFPGAEVFQSASMAIATATLFLLAALCLFRLSKRQRESDITLVVAATIGLVLTLVALTGYAFDSEALYEVSIFTAMALHTAAAFACLFAAILTSRPKLGWVGILLGEGGGSRAARNLVPIAIALPFLLIFAALAATEAGLFNPNFRASVLAIAMMVLLSAAALRAAQVQNRIEQRLRKTLKQRDLLLREVHHRVKNNMQMTISLLRMGSSDVSDPEAEAALEATISRVEALGVVHQMLFDRDIPSDVSVSAFLRELVDNVTTAYILGERDIQLDVEAPDRLLYVDTAVTFSLLANELLINAVKHAFVGSDRRGTVRLVFREDENEARLSVIDNGQGLPDDLDPQKGGGTGMGIVRGLVRQLAGKLHYEQAPGGGTAAHVTVPASRLEEGRYE